MVVVDVEEDVDVVELVVLDGWVCEVETVVVEVEVVLVAN